MPIILGRPFLAIGRALVLIQWEPFSWEASPAGPALTCPQTASPHQAAGIAKCSATKQAFPNTTDAEVAKEVGGRK